MDASVLSDPVRRRLYDHVRGAPGTTRDGAAGAAGISRTLAAYHLDRLVAAGLLRVDYARPAGRGGPGAGRPAKRYWALRDEVVVSVPPRDYGLMARLFVGAVDAAGSPELRARVLALAEEEGRAAGTGPAELVDALRSRGYEPVLADGGDVEMRNCPFHRLAEANGPLVCAVNHALVRGVLAGRGEDADRAELAPAPGRCCVVVHPAVPGD